MFLKYSLRSPSTSPPPQSVQQPNNYEYESQQYDCSCFGGNKSKNPMMMGSTSGGYQSNRYRNGWVRGARKDNINKYGSQGKTGDNKPDQNKGINTNTTSLGFSSKVGQYKNDSDTIGQTKNQEQGRGKNIVSQQYATNVTNQSQNVAMCHPSSTHNNNNKALVRHCHNNMETVVNTKSPISSVHQSPMVSLSAHLKAIKKKKMQDVIDTSLDDCNQEREGSNGKLIRAGTIGGDRIPNQPNTQCRPSHLSPKDSHISNINNHTKSNYQSPIKQINNCKPYSNQGEQFNYSRVAEANGSLGVNKSNSSNNISLLNKQKKSLKKGFVKEKGKNSHVIQDIGNNGGTLRFNQTNQTGNYLNQTNQAGNYLSGQSVPTRGINNTEGPNIRIANSPNYNQRYNPTYLPPQFNTNPIYRPNLSPFNWAPGASEGQQNIAFQSSQSTIAMPQSTIYPQFQFSQLPLMPHHGSHIVIRPKHPPFRQNSPQIVTQLGLQTIGRVQHGQNGIMKETNQINVNHNVVAQHQPSGYPLTGNSNTTNSQTGSPVFGNSRQEINRIDSIKQVAQYSKDSPIRPIQTVSQPTDRSMQLKSPLQTHQRFLSTDSYDISTVSNQTILQLRLDPNNRFQIGDKGALNNGTSNSHYNQRQANLTGLIDNRNFGINGLTYNNTQRYNQVASNQSKPASLFALLQNAAQQIPPSSANTIYLNSIGTTPINSQQEVIVGALSTDRSQRRRTQWKVDHPIHDEGESFEDNGRYSHPYGVSTERADPMVWDKLHSSPRKITLTPSSGHGYKLSFDAKIAQMDSQQTRSPLLKNCRNQINQFYSRVTAHSRRIYPKDSQSILNSSSSSNEDYSTHSEVLQQHSAQPGGQWNMRRANQQQEQQEKSPSHRLPSQVKNNVSPSMPEYRLRLLTLESVKSGNSVFKPCQTISDQTSNTFPRGIDHSQMEMAHFGNMQLHKRDGSAGNSGRLQKLGPYGLTTQSYLESGR